MAIVSGQSGIFALLGHLQNDTGGICRDFYFGAAWGAGSAAAAGAEREAADCGHVRHLCPGTLVRYGQHSSDSGVGIVLRQLAVRWRRNHIGAGNRSENRGHLTIHGRYGCGGVLSLLAAAWYSVAGASPGRAANDAWLARASCANLARRGARRASDPGRERAPSRHFLFRVALVSCFARVLLGNACFWQYIAKNGGADVR